MKKFLPFLVFICHCSFGQEKESYLLKWIKTAKETPCVFNTDWNKPERTPEEEKDYFNRLIEDATIETEIIKINQTSITAEAEIFLSVDDEIKKLRNVTTIVIDGVYDSKGQNLLLEKRVVINSNSRGQMIAWSTGNKTKHALPIKPFTGGKITVKGKAYTGLEYIAEPIVFKKSEIGKSLKHSIETFTLIDWKDNYVVFGVDDFSKEKQYKPTLASKEKTFILSNNNEDRTYASFSSITESELGIKQPPSSYYVLLYRICPEIESFSFAYPPQGKVYATEFKKEVVIKK
jgi:hypothetical protein